MAPKIPKVIKCSSPAVLDYELGIVREGLEVTESEETWDKIQNTILYLTALINGAGAEYPTQIVSAIKGFSRPISKSLISERSRLSGATTDMLSVLVTTVGRPFEPLIPPLVPTLLTLASRPNKVYISRAKSCLLAIVENCQSPAILPFLRQVVSDKSITLRLTATDLVMACLNCYNPPDLEVPARAEDVEAVIKATARDSSADVRKSSRKVFEAYKILLPSRVERFVGPLTPVMKKYLDIKGTTAAQKKTLVPTTSKPPLSRPELNKSQTNQAGKSGSKPAAPVPSLTNSAALTTGKIHVEADKSKKVTEEAPLQRLPSSGPVRPPPSMRQAIAAARPFPIHRGRIGHLANNATGTDMSKNQPAREGPRRPERALPPSTIPPANNVMSAQEAEPSSAPSAHSLRRIPKVEMELELNVTTSRGEAAKEMDSLSSSTSSTSTQQTKARSRPVSRLEPLEVELNEENVDRRKRIRHRTEESLQVRPTSRTEGEKRTRSTTNPSGKSQSTHHRDVDPQLKNHAQSTSEVVNPTKSKRSSREQNTDKAVSKKRRGEEESNRNPEEKGRRKKRDDLAQEVSNDPGLKRKSSKRRREVHAPKNEEPVEPEVSTLVEVPYEPRTPIRREQQVLDVQYPLEAQTAVYDNRDEILPELIPLPVTPVQIPDTKSDTTPEPAYAGEDVSPTAATPTPIPIQEVRSVEESSTPKSTSDCSDTVEKSEKVVSPIPLKLPGTSTVKPLFIKKSSNRGNKGEASKEKEGTGEEGYAIKDQSSPPEVGFVPSIPEGQMQFMTPAVLRTNMEEAKEHYQVAATPISSLLKSIEQGFDSEASMISMDMGVIGEEDETEDLDLTLPAITEKQFVPSSALETRRKKPNNITSNEDYKENDSSSDEDCLVFFSEKRPRKAHNGKTRAQDRVPFTPRKGNN